MRHQKRFQTRAASRVVAVLLCATALLSNSLLVGAQQQTMRAQASSRPSETERVVHVLNRLGFGARPGDVERVRQIGLERYVEQQLRPEAMKDEIAEAKLRDLTTLHMSTGELLAKYPNPNLLVRRLQRSGQLPEDLREVVEARRGANQAPRQANEANQANKPGATADEESAPDASMKAPAAGAMENMEAMPPPQGADAERDPEREKYRRVIMEYMRENGMQPPQRIMVELQASRILRAVYSERQLQEVMVDFWSNHFNVFAGKGADRWLLTSYDRDVIRPHTFGKFRDLLGATAKSPAMLFYLDNFQSVSPKAQQAGGMGQRRARPLADLLGAIGGGRMRNRRQQMPPPPDGDGQMSPEQMQQRPAQQRRQRGINENYARELMELHTLGVEGGYTQKDVQEVARAFTGWTIFDPRGIMGNPNTGKFYFNPRLHDDGEKVVLGQKIPAGGGQKDGEMVLDILARHPSTAKFVATKLARRFVSDNPSPALVERVAAAYTKSDGDTRETLRAVFASPEFNSAEARRAKIKTPFELAVSAIRTLGGETNGGPATHGWIARMGEPLYLYQAPTGYPDTAEHWVNTGALLERLNFALALVSNRIPGTRVNLARFTGETSPSGGGVEGSAAQERVVEQFLGVILQGDVSPKTKATLLKQLGDKSIVPVAPEGNASATPPDAMTTGDRAARRAYRQNAGGGGGRRGGGGSTPSAELAGVANPEIARIAALILGTPEFQRQ